MKTDLNPHSTLITGMKPVVLIKEKEVIASVLVKRNNVSGKPNLLIKVLAKILVKNLKGLIIIVSLFVCFVCFSFISTKENFNTKLFYLKCFR